MFLVGAVEQLSPFFAVSEGTCCCVVCVFVILELGTAVRLWSQFHNLFDWRISNFVGWRVTPPDPRPEGRESRLFFDFLGRESTPDAKKGEKGPRVGSSGREFA